MNTVNESLDLWKSRIGNCFVKNMNEIYQLYARVNIRFSFLVSDCAKIGSCQRNRQNLHPDQSGFVSQREHRGGQVWRDERVQLHLHLQTRFPARRSTSCHVQVRQVGRRHPNVQRGPADIKLVDPDHPWSLRSHSHPRNTNLFATKKAVGTILQESSQQKTAHACCSIHSSKYKVEMPPTTICLLIYISGVQPCHHSPHVATGSLNMATSSIS